MTTRTGLFPIIWVTILLAGNHGHRSSRDESSRLTFIRNQDNFDQQRIRLLGEHQMYFDPKGARLKLNSNLHHERLATGARIFPKIKQNYTSYAGNYTKETVTDLVSSEKTFRTFGNKSANFDPFDQEFLQDINEDDVNHDRVLVNVLVGLSEILSKFGFGPDYCSPTFTIHDIHLASRDITEHLFLNSSKKSTKLWKDASHPLRRRIREITDKLLVHKEDCNFGGSRQNRIKNSFEKLIFNLDNGLKKYLSAKIFPIIDYVSSSPYDLVEKLFPILVHICTGTFGEKGSSVILCEKDLLRLILKVHDRQSEDNSNTDHLMRYKRYAEVEESETLLTSEDSASPVISTDIEKSGSYGAEGYGGYDDPGVIVVPHEDYDTSYPYLLKFLAALSIATWVFLGLLAAQTLAALILLAGPKGAKGDKGPKGIKGMKGDKGMKGIKGMKGDKGIKGVQGPSGAIGDTGEAGETGEAGVIGDTGPKGFKGPIGTMGTKGTKGPKGAKGDKGDKGAKGLKGVKGNPGRKKRAAHNSQLGSDMPDLHDTPQLLEVLYRANNINAQETYQNFTKMEMVDIMNSLWKQLQSPVGCLRCVLFEYLSVQPSDSLDSYITAGFAHVLGDSGSLQLLDDVRRGRQRGVKMRCRRKKNSCNVQYLKNI
ncbi:uncharacterized protein LOC108669319 [Hyalella azteca]|uniref:Uncharacterized protein LOC108669319 n=1 Tax=Hyalella azteca TaxID=294128 RepID=A0A8B7NF89_HYAAZ|nr:uncharacterized protein LOC108669319 [Hyalella azteca]XP_018012111.1 uncharacterized protein LOC108669319 [Hyalella azteca]